MTGPVAYHSIQFEVPIRAHLRSVWKGLVDETTQWWAKDFYTNQRTKGFYIEPKVGGRMFEDFGENEGLLWAEVIGVDSPNSIQMKGLLTPDFGGPAISFVKLSLKQQGSETLLNVSDALFGAVNEGTAKQVEAGWRMIYEQAFKGYMENK